MPHGQLEFLSESEKKNRGSGEGCCFPELTELSKPGTAVSCLSQVLLLPYPPVHQRRERHSQRGQLVPSDGTSQGKCDGSRAAGGLGSPLPSSLPEDQWGGSSGAICSGTSQQPVQAESRCYCFQVTVPKEDNQACLHTASCDISHVRELKVSLSNWSGKMLCTAAYIHEDAILLGLKGSEGEGNS